MDVFEMQTYPLGMINMFIASAYTSVKKNWFEYTLEAF